MSKYLRLKCTCGKVINGFNGSVCPSCNRPFDIPAEGMIHLYRKGSPLGIVNGFSVYINGESYGAIGNKETINIPVKYGSYRLHVACGMNRRCNDIIINITPQTPVGYMKVWMKPGFWTNSFVLEPSTRDEMPL